MYIYGFTFPNFLRFLIWQPSDLGGPVSGFDHILLAIHENAKFLLAIEHFEHFFQYISYWNSLSGCLCDSIKNILNNFMPHQ